MEPDEKLPGDEYKPLRPVDEVPYEPHHEQTETCVLCACAVASGNCCVRCFWHGR